MIKLVVNDDNKYLDPNHHSMKGFSIAINTVAEK